MFYEPVQSSVPTLVFIFCGITLLFFPLVLLSMLFVAILEAITPQPPGPTADASGTAERALRERIERELKEPKR